jgi:hypothetical protein
MSGPITRQYGVPNWDDIFGKKEEPTQDARQTKVQPEPPSPSTEETSEEDQPRLP